MNNGVFIGFTKKGANIPPAGTYPQIEIVFFSEAARTLTEADINKVMTSTSASAVTLTLPQMSVRSGECIHVKQGGAGQITVVAGSGVTIDIASTVKKTRAQESIINKNYPD